jgi:hypothetical protein
VAAISEKLKILYMALAPTYESPPFTQGYFSRGKKEAPFARAIPMIQLMFLTP